MSNCNDVCIIIMATLDCFVLFVCVVFPPKKKILDN